MYTVVVMDLLSKQSLCDDNEGRSNQLEDHLVANEETFLKYRALTIVPKIQR